MRVGGIGYLQVVVVNGERYEGIFYPFFLPDIHFCYDQD